MAWRVQNFGTNMAFGRWMPYNEGGNKGGSWYLCVESVPSLISIFNLWKDKIRAIRLRLMNYITNSAFLNLANALKSNSNWENWRWEEGIYGPIQ